MQRTIGVTDYERRDAALKQLIQPLAGEYGMHNGQPQGERCWGRWGQGAAGKQQLGEAGVKRSTAPAQNARPQCAAAAAPGEEPRHPRCPFCPPCPRLQRARTASCLRFGMLT